MGRETITAWSGELQTGTALKTFLQVAADAETDLMIEEIYCGGKRAPTNVTDVPGLLTVMKQTTNGGGAGVAHTPKAWPGKTTATKLGTWLRGPAGTWAAAGGAEPTASDEFIHREIPSSQGYTWRGELLVPAGDRCGFCLTFGVDIPAMIEVLFRRA